MLVLTRKRTEMIKVGDDIVITVIHTSKGSVKLGIQAPTNVRVLRAELDHRPAETSDVRPDADEEVEVLEFPMFSANPFLDAFNADDIADLEDQALLCLSE